LNKKHSRKLATIYNTQMFKKFYSTLMARIGLISGGTFATGKMPKSIFARRHLKENIEELKAG
jgi:hypothetical protein